VLRWHFEDSSLAFSIFNLCSVNVLKRGERLIREWGESQGEMLPIPGDYLGILMIQVLKLLKVFHHTALF